MYGLRLRATAEGRSLHFGIVCRLCCLNTPKSISNWLSTASNGHDTLDDTTLSQTSSSDLCRPSCTSKAPY
jgi:hypothetical protein